MDNNDFWDICIENDMKPNPEDMNLFTADDLITMDANLGDEMDLDGLNAMSQRDRVFFKLYIRIFEELQCISSALHDIANNV